MVQGCWLSRDGTAPVQATGTGASGAGSVGGGGSGGGITTSSTSSGGGGPEYCVDGVDNDGDGDVDCADSDCYGFSCVPAVDGALAYLTPPEALPSCAAPTVPLEVQSCEGCQCDDIPISCTVSLMMHSGGGCTGSGTTYSSPNACVDVADGAHSFTATTTPVGATDCNATLPAVDPTVREGCSVPQAGVCSTGEACLPNSLVDGSTCVLLSGHVDCPAAYPSRAEVYQGAAAQCACACAPHSTICDDVHIEYSDWNSGCGSGLYWLAVGATCVDANWVDAFVLPDAAGAATCDPGGTPSDGTAVTLCCAQ